LDAAEDATTKRFIIANRHPDSAVVGGIGVGGARFGDIDAACARAGFGANSAD
jgi:uncharacterized protein GlcG (DUF336 family)